MSMPEESNGSVKLREAQERILRLFYQTWAQGERWTVLEEFLDEFAPFSEDDWKTLLHPTMDALIHIGKKVSIALAASMLFDVDGDGVPDLVVYILRIMIGGVGCKI